MAEVHGTCDKRFDAVRVALAESLDDADVGASAAVFVDGEPVADLWGGYKDAKRTEPWEQDTITNVWSTTKTMVALSALILADRGDLDLDAPVASYWPEFAAAGKERVLVRHLLSHTAGLPEFDPPAAVEDLYHWAKATDRLARQAPRWEPGTLAGYHSITQGFLVGELVRRVTGQSLATFFADHIAKPVGADFHLTMPTGTGLDERFAPVLAPPDSPDGDLVAAPPGDHSQDQYRGVDQIMGRSVRYGLGYGIFDPEVGWGGWGGSMVMVDLDARMAVAYVMNQMLQSDYRGLGIVLAAYDGLG